MRLRCIVPAAAVRRSPDVSTEQANQMLFGEDFTVERREEGWVYGRTARDAYAGWVEAAALAEREGEPTHAVAALRTYGLPQPDKKSTPAPVYSMNALVRAGRREDGFVLCEGAGWIFAEHLRPIGEHEADFVAVAERFVGAPYQWGGRESVGLDCSGLVQQALYACGFPCPRDSREQARSLGRPLPEGEPLRRGDLVFWAGHVAIMVDEARLIHATSVHMDVRIEAFETAAGRGAPTGVRRL